MYLDLFTCPDGWARLAYYSANAGHYTVVYYEWYVLRASNGCQQSTYAFGMMMKNMAQDMICIKDCQATSHL